QRTDGLFKKVARLGMSRQQFLDALALDRVPCTGPVQELRAFVEIVHPQRFEKDALFVHGNPSGRARLPFPLPMRRLTAKTVTKNLLTALSWPAHPRAYGVSMSPRVICRYSQVCA